MGDRAKRAQVAAPPNRSLSGCPTYLRLPRRRLLPPHAKRRHAKRRYADTLCPRRYALPLPAPGSLNVRVSGLADLSSHIALGFHVLGLEPREVTYQIVKDKDLPVAFRA